MDINSGAQTCKTLQTVAASGTTNVSVALATGTIVNANATTNFSVSQTLGALNIGTVPPLAGFSGGSVVVPEPGSMGLLLFGALGLAARRRRSV